MNKNQYDKPNCKIIFYKNEDILTASGIIDNNTDVDLEENPDNLFKD